jgi:glutaredoxin 3
MNKKIVIYTTNYCPFCNYAKALFKDKNVSFNEINIDGDDVKKEWIARHSGSTTLPQIFIDDVCYGGFEDIKELDTKGELDKILQIPE